MPTEQESPDSERQVPVIERPEELTAAGARFFDAHLEVANFILFVANLAVRADKTRETALKALLDTAREGDTEERERLERTMKEGDVVTHTLRKNYRQLLFETTLSRGVDNLLTYVAELMSVVFKTRPETLRSRAKVEIARILSHDTMDDLIEDLAERRVEELAYAGLRELQDSLGASLGFTLFPTEADLERAVALVEGRNIVVHNRGRVNKTYLSRVPASSRKLGERLRFVDVDEFFDDLAFLARSGGDIDARASVKWGIPRSTSDSGSDNGEVTGPDATEPNEPESETADS